MPKQRWWRSRATLVGLAALVAAGCASTSSSTAPTTSAPPTSAAPASTTAPTTAAPTAAAPTAAATPTAAPSGSAPLTGPCDGSGGVPAGATDTTSIHGDIDGDLHDDTVTAYSLDGTPHVHAQLFIGQQSDVALPLGFADTVTIGFEDIDHSAGAPTPPPVAVMAVGTGNAGSAYLAFLTLTRHYCIAPWTHDGELFQIRVSQQDPYTGLTCDGAAGSIHYTIVNAEQQPDSRWKVTSEALKHDFTTAILTSLPDRVVADSSRISVEYGDVVGCSHPPLFS